jgi:hypothetical protein
VFIGLKPRSELFVAFSFVNSLTPEIGINPLNLAAKLVALPERIGSKAPIAQSDIPEDDQEFELLYNPQLKVFYSYMTSGAFLLNVRV